MLPVLMQTHFSDDSVIIRKDICTAHISHIEWNHRVLHNSTSNTYTPTKAYTYTHTHTHTHTQRHTHTHTHTHTRICTGTHHTPLSFFVFCLNLSFLHLLQSDLQLFGSKTTCSAWLVYGFSDLLSATRCIWIL